MPFFTSGSVKIAYLDTLSDKNFPQPVSKPFPIVLIHGFASNLQVNWVDTGWVKTLSRAGFRVIAPDIRGHGESDKLYTPEDYHPSLMAEDIRRLLDHLAIDKAHIMGYSMGARIAAFLALAAPSRLKKLVFSGMGLNLVEGMGDPRPIVEALEAHEENVQNLSQVGKRFREFALRTNSDLPALAACMRACRTLPAREAFVALTLPVLVVVGSQDDIAGSGQALAALLPSGEFLEIPNRNHMSSVGDPLHKRGVLAFLHCTSCGTNDEL